MTENQKAYVRFMRTIAITFVAMLAFVIICSNYGEPPKVEYSPIAPQAQQEQ